MESAQNSAWHMVTAGSSWLRMISPAPPGGSPWGLPVGVAGTASWSAQAIGTGTEYHGLGDLNNRRLFSHSSGGCKSEIRVSTWSGSGEDPLPGVQTAALPLCAHMPSPCTFLERDLSLSLFL